jgi:hypothetical protein
MAQLIFTRGVNDEMAGDTKFAKHVTESLARFASQDWGDISKEDSSENDAVFIVKNGRILASYEGTKKIWIIKESADHLGCDGSDGHGAVTVLFPSEY